MSRAAVDPDQPGPFLKWAGSKAFLWTKHPQYVPAPAPGGRWGEPFLGSGGLFYSLPPDRRRRALLSDINPRIVGVHVAVRDHVEEVIRELADIREQRHAFEEAGPDAVAEHYYRLRRHFNLPGLAPACPTAGALFIALNHLCMNGLYRENQAGEFNVSVGDYTKPPIFDPEHLRACSRALADADLQVLDCEPAVARLGPEDACLLDVPYEPVSATATFTSYSRGGGDWGASTSQLALPGLDVASKRQRFASQLADLDARGVRFVTTDADTRATRELYGRWLIQTIQVPRTISRKADARLPAAELVVRNWS